VLITFINIIKCFLFMENTMAFKEYKIIHVVEDGLGKILIQSDIGFLPHFFAISIKRPDF